MNPLPNIARKVSASFNNRLDRLWNRGLPEHTYLTCRIRWPLVALVLLLLNQLLAPHPAWITLIITIAGLYAAGYVWLRQLARHLALERTREGSVLVAGDVLAENFTLHNHSIAPLVWAELRDESTVPGYVASRVVACQGRARTSWRIETTCQRRGLFRLGPHVLVAVDPFALFRLELTTPAHQRATESVAIYPRVAALPDFPLPKGRARGAQRYTRPWQGDRRADTVREHRPGDSLRHIHWRHSARHRQLMVTETEIDTGRDLWIALDLDTVQHSIRDDNSTLETSVVAAASLAADLLNRSARHRVGLLTAQATLPPQSGTGHLWRILGTLAAAEPTTISLSQLLHSQRRVLGRSLVVITALPPQNHLPAAEYLDDFAADWVTPLVDLRVTGIASSVLLVTPALAVGSARDVAPVPAAPAANGSLAPAASIASRVDALRDLLARHEIPLRPLSADADLPPVLTHRRTRTVLRTTPTGGVIVRQVEEEVG